MEYAEKKKLDSTEREHNPAVYYDMEGRPIHPSDIVYGKHFGMKIPCEPVMSKEDMILQYLECVKIVQEEKYRNCRGGNWCSQMAYYTDGTTDMVDEIYDKIKKLIKEIE
ncbi:MAG: hypothetical protein OXF77_00915 [Thaumarchaeota archaeon]|nr:hypothetical protein [Nitrososphaerota archaeon]